MVTHPVVLVRGGGGGKRLKRGRPGGTVVGRMRIRVGMGVRGRVRVSRVRRRRRRWPLVEVRIILIHHLGTAHHPARARHPRAGLPTCVPERRTTRSYTIFSFHFVHFVLQSCSLSLFLSLSLSLCLSPLGVCPCTLRSYDRARRSPLGRSRSIKTPTNDRRKRQADRCIFAALRRRMTTRFARLSVCRVSVTRGFWAERLPRTRFLHVRL